MRNFRSKECTRKITIATRQHVRCLVQVGLKKSNSPSCSVPFLLIAMDVTIFWAHQLLFSLSLNILKANEGIRMNSNYVSIATSRFITTENNFSIPWNQFWSLPCCTRKWYLQNIFLYNTGLWSPLQYSTVVKADVNLEFINYPLLCFDANLARFFCGFTPPKLQNTNSVLCKVNRGSSTKRYRSSKLNCTRITAHSNCKARDEPPELFPASLSCTGLDWSTLQQIPATQHLQRSVNIAIAPFRLASKQILHKPRFSHLSESFPCVC